jgi:hypothetical protein
VSLACQRFADILGNRALENHSYLLVLFQGELASFCSTVRLGEPIYCHRQWQSIDISFRGRLARPGSAIGKGANDSHLYRLLRHRHKLAVGTEDSEGDGDGKGVAEMLSKLLGPVRFPKQLFFDVPSISRIPPCPLLPTLTSG